MKGKTQICILLFDWDINNASEIAFGTLLLDQYNPKDTADICVSPALVSPACFFEVRKDNNFAHEKMVLVNSW
jgi:hypothetical protein